MSDVKSTVMYGQPTTLYLRCTNGFINAHNVIGETSRSWITGHSWSPFKYSKRDYTVVDKREYDEYQWALRNASKIVDRIYGYRLKIDPATLRKVAEVIGYKEENI